MKIEVTTVQLVDIKDQPTKTFGDFALHKRIKGAGFHLLLRGRLFIDDVLSDAYGCGDRVAIKKLSSNHYKHVLTANKSIVRYSNVDNVCFSLLFESEDCGNYVGIRHTRNGPYCLYSKKTNTETAAKIA